MYKITIVEIVPNPDNKYNNEAEITVYQQRVEVLNLKAVILAINPEPNQDHRAKIQMEALNRPLPE